MFPRWFVSVCRHWLAALAGAALSVGLLLFDWFGPGQASIPQWVFYVLVLVGLLIACFLSWKDEAERADKFEGDLQRLRSTRPRLEVVGQKWVRLFENGQYRFHVLGIWIA